MRPTRPWRINSRLPVRSVRSSIAGSARPMFNRLTETGAADRSERLRNSAAGLASSLRLCGTGTQVPSWDRLGSLTPPVLCRGRNRRCSLRRACPAPGPPRTPRRGHARPRWRPRRPPGSARADGASGRPLVARRRPGLRLRHRSTPEGRAAVRPRSGGEPCRPAWAGALGPACRSGPGARERRPAGWRPGR